MAFCSYSNDKLKENSTLLENDFFTDYMPLAPENAVKVYLFGLYICNNSSSKYQTLESMSILLDIPEVDIVDYFYYWQELNAVTILNTDPLEVKYNPLKKASPKLKKFDSKKYENFNIFVQEYISGRQITPTEYSEYYYFLESMHMTQDAFVRIVKYCVELKGNNVGYSYILTIAKNWAYEGILSLDQVEERLLDQEKNTSNVVDILKALGLKRTPTTDEYNMFLTWTKELEFPLDSIVYLAKKQGKNSGGMVRLNTTIMKCYALKKESIKELQDFFNHEKELYETAKIVCKNLGLYYNNLDNVVETYISKWNDLGYDSPTLAKISNYCFRLSIKSLQGMDSKISSLFKLGLLTSTDIDRYIDELVQADREILEILQKLNIERQVNASDRQLFKTWKYDWIIADDILNYCVAESCDKYMPMQYLNKLLSQVHMQKLTSLDAVKEHIAKMPKSTQVSPKKFTERSYTKKELNSLFVNDISEVEI